MAKRIVVVLWGAPTPIYKGGEEEAGHQGRAKERGVLLGLQS